MEKFKKLFLSNPIIIILFFAVLFRVLFIILFSNWQPTSDYNWYYNQSINFVRYNDFLNSDGTSTAYWPIGYPLFLGALFKITGESIILIQILNIIFNSISIFTFYFILNRLQPKKFLFNNLLTIIFAFYPDNIAFNIISSPEIIYVTLLLLSLLFVLNNYKFKYFYISLFTGIATLLKPQAIIMPFIFLGIEYFYNKVNIRATLFNFIIVVLTIFTIISPVLIRNFKIFGNFIFISNNGGINLYIGNNEHANGRYVETNYLNSLKRAPDLNEYQIDKIAKSKAINYLRTNPESIIINIPKKIIGYFGYVSGFNWVNEGLNKKMEKTIWVLLMGISNLYYWIILLAFLFSLGYLFINKIKLDSNIMLLIGIILYFICLHCIIFFGSPKYNQTIIPFILLFISMVLNKYYKNIIAA